MVNDVNLNKTVNLDQNIFERQKSGEYISVDDPDYLKISKIISKARKITAKLNSSYHKDKKVRKFISKLTGYQVDKSLSIRPPFYTEYGRNIVFGKNVFINHACTFMDRGGIIIEDNVKIGPKVNLITTNHSLLPLERTDVINKQIWIHKNVWIGVNATILSGVTIGENSVVAAASVVTKNVPPNTLVAGIPAKVIKSIG